MPILEIAQLALAFWDRAAPLVTAGIDITKAYQEQNAREAALLASNTAPTPADFAAMHSSLEPLEKSIQAAHRDVPDSPGI